MTSPSEERWVMTPDRTGVKPLHVLSIVLHTYNCDTATTVSSNMLMLTLIIHVVFNSR